MVSAIISLENTDLMVPAPFATVDEVPRKSPYWNRKVTISSASGDFMSTFLVQLLMYWFFLCDLRDGCLPMFSTSAYIFVYSEIFFF